MPQLVANQDPNNLPVFSLCYCTNQQNAPSNYTMVFTLGGKSVGDMAQLGITSDYIYSRFKSVGVWSDWVLNYNSNILTNNTILSSLASALGGGVLTSSHPDDIKTPGIYRNSTTQGFPLTDTGTLLVVYYGDYITQFWTSDNKINLYERVYTNSWQAWQDVTFAMPSFYKNYSTIELLASAIGNASKMKWHTTNLSCGSGANIDAETIIKNITADTPDPSSSRYIHFGLCSNDGQGFYLLHNYALGLKNGMFIYSTGFVVMQGGSLVMVYTNNGTAGQRSI